VTGGLLFCPSKNPVETYILYVGRLEKQKRVDELIKLSKELNTPLTIIGDGFESEELKKLVKKIHAPVEFLGVVPHNKELVKIYQNCMFFISASEWESFGLIFLEAAACGKPSIGYNVFAIPEVILHGQTGFLANNYHELKIYCEKLIKDKEQRNKMGKNALKFSKENGGYFSMNSNCIRFIYPYISKSNKNVKMSLI